MAINLVVYVGQEGCFHPSVIKQVLFFLQISPWVKKACMS